MELPESSPELVYLSIIGFVVIILVELVWYFGPWRKRGKGPGSGGGGGGGNEPDAPRPSAPANWTYYNQPDPMAGKMVFFIPLLIGIVVAFGLILFLTSFK